MEDLSLLKLSLSKLVCLSLDSKNLLATFPKKGMSAKTTFARLRCLPGDKTLSTVAAPQSTPTSDPNRTHQKHK
jgi:hypothetical protein